MKFFKEFKWHVWQSPSTGKWYVRKRILFSYIYLSKSGFTFRSENLVVKHCANHSLQEALDTLNKFVI